MSNNNQEEIRLYSKEAYELANIVKSFLKETEKGDMKEAIKDAENLLEECEKYLNGYRKSRVHLDKI